MTLLRELIDIPERVSQGDFVLKLTEGVDHADQTLADYVVTPQLVDCFNTALSLIHQSVETSASKAAILHGSFGSGKSHFMAVLNLLLAGNPRARGVAELAPVVASHDRWMAGRRFLLVTQHMIGQESLEGGIFQAYLDHIKRLHPDAPVPALWRGEAVLADAEHTRRAVGDETFLRTMNEGAAAEPDDGWGTLAAQGWDVARLDAARLAAPGTPDRDRLLGDLLRTWFRSYTDAVRGGAEAYVELDGGLAVMSRHAADLGYDGVILFLDELVLWLASHLADLGWVSREASKVVKLVEAASADRPVPIVSFIARQRDLAELVGANTLGDQHAAVSDILRHQEGRFAVVHLEDRNLPAIARQRVLRPRDEAARAQIDAAFAETQRLRPQVLDTLLTSDGDRAMFRDTYPFSPAFMKTLVAVSAALQRNRTALRVLVQLLVDHRDDLELGTIVGVGDLYDVIASGDDPFDQTMRQLFATAKQLYATKLRPVLLATDGLTEDDVATLAPGHVFWADDRLAKTLLLSALVPELEPLRDLTASRLADLNHGTITAPIAGTERQVVLTKLRRWAADVGELRVGEDPVNPTVALQLSGVDTRVILDQGQVADNAGARKLAVRRLLLERMGVGDAGTLTFSHRLAWRGTSRNVELVFANVFEPGEVPDTELLGTTGDWRIVIDLPLDAEHSATDHRARLEGLQSLGAGAHTVCWLASFLTKRSQDDLGRLVVLDHVLSPDRFNDYARNLPAVERETARGLLDNQRSALRQRLGAVLEQAYGIATPQPDAVTSDLELAEHFVAIDRSLRLRPPAVNTLADGLSALTGQALAHQLPAHPSFEGEVKAAEVRRVFEQIRRAIASPDGRVIVDGSMRKAMRVIANPLRLGTQSDQAFVIDTHWRNHFEARIARQAGAPVTVRLLRAWTDDPEPMGLPRDLANLVIATFADQTGRVFRKGGQVMAPTIDGLGDDLEVVESELPDEAAWETALSLAGAIFGITVSRLRSVGNVTELSERLREHSSRVRGPASALATALGGRLTALGDLADGRPHALGDAGDGRLTAPGGPGDGRLTAPGGPGGARRLGTAQSALALVETLCASRGDSAITVLADAPLGGATPEAVARSLATAADVERALRDTPWSVIEPALRLSGSEAGAAEELRRQLVGALGDDELAHPLAEALRTIVASASALLARGRQDQVPPSGQPRVEASPAPSGGGPVGAPA